VVVQTNVFSGTAQCKSDGQRSVGLGLVIAAKIVVAHGGPSGSGVHSRPRCDVYIHIANPIIKIGQGAGTLMITGIFGQQLTLMEELKARTYRAHVQLQSAPLFQALVSCQLPLESYVGQLRALSVIHGVLEQALESCAEERVASVWHRKMCRLSRLQQDLRYFEPRAVADLKEATEAALKTAEHIRLNSLVQPLSLLACLYVLEGSMLGAIVLRPLYAKAFLLKGEEGMSYMHSDGLPANVRWEQFHGRMNALRLSEEEREEMIKAINDFFARVEEIYLALYPFRLESKTYLVTSINPEAGRHPIPSDAREVQASIKAADICWQRFPYFEHRYGERGKNFARSDAAWLATLCQCDQLQIIQQVRWLGHVLASRGMPTLLLQVQLEILAEELAAVDPEKKSEYIKLSESASELSNTRRRHLTDAQIQAIAADFDHAVGIEWSTRFPHTGELLASAVTDESEGNEGAVESLRSWMIDARRFPAEWIAAVEKTLAQIQVQVGSKNGSCK